MQRLILRIRIENGQGAPWERLPAREKNAGIKTTIFLHG